MRRGPVAFVLFALCAWATPAVAQVALVPDAPLQVGVSWSRGTPQGDLAGVIEPPQGFVAWLSLPVTRRSALGVRGEFAILTLPEQVLTVPYATPSGTITLDVSIRGTLAFTGAGPRLALGVGPMQVGLGAMVGVVRGINDLSARASVGDLSISDAASVSDFTVGLKGVVDGYLPVYRGIRGTSIGLTGGIDWFTGGSLEFVRRSSLSVDASGNLQIERVVNHPTMLVIRAGIGAAF